MNIKGNEDIYTKESHIFNNKDVLTTLYPDLTWEIESVQTAPLGTRLNKKLSPLYQSDGEIEVYGGNIWEDKRVHDLRDDFINSTIGIFKKSEDSSKLAYYCTYITNGDIPEGTYLFQQEIRFI